MNDHYKRLLERFSKGRKRVKKGVKMTWEMLNRMKSEMKFFDEYLWERTRKCSCGQIPFDIHHKRLNPEPVLSTLNSLYERKMKNIQKWERRLKAIDKRF